jgi:hypothetical protein
LHLVGILFPHINDNARSKSLRFHLCYFVLRYTCHLSALNCQRHSCIYLANIYNWEQNIWIFNTVNCLFVLVETSWHSFDTQA